MHPEREKAFLVRYAASLGSKPWMWVVAAAFILFLPLGFALIVLTGVLTVSQVQAKKAREELDPIITAMMTFAKASDIEKVILIARKEGLSGTPAVRVCEALTTTLKMAKKRGTCSSGHMLGCPHRRVDENQAWPGLLREAIRKGND